MNGSSKARKLRIIGGQWRSRQVAFPDVDGIRPTPDRVRETLFNWLQFDTPNANCLEPFAGSGALSLEALSRGARHCTILDQSSAAIAHIQSAITELGGLERAACQTVDARTWLKNPPSRGFDLIFLDPPFAAKDLSELIGLCAELLSEDGKIYVESANPIEPQGLPGNLEIHRQKRAGAVHFALLISG